MRVLSELETMQRVAEGNLSLARLGRCELRLMQGHSGLAQGNNDKLCRALRKVIRSQLQPLMVCVPRIFEAMPPGKVKWYREFLEPRVVPDLFRDRVYGSTFVSRRDAWVGMDDEAGYWQIVRGIWQDRPVLLVAGSDKGLAAREFLGNAASVQVLQSMARDAWVDRDRLMAECLRWVSLAPRQHAPLIYLALGATATVLAHDLTLCGIQALDMGHCASSWSHSGKQAEVAA